VHNPKTWLELFPSGTAANQSAKRYGRFLRMPDNEQAQNGAIFNGDATATLVA
jgi:hypothetical protein